jgi:hypothetical protein
MNDDGDFIDMMCTPDEVIQIGVGARVSSRSLDSSGQERIIDLKECVSNLTDITDRRVRLCNSSRWSVALVLCQVCPYH